MDKTGTIYLCLKLTVKYPLQKDTAPWPRHRFLKRTVLNNFHATLFVWQYIFYFNQHNGLVQLVLAGLPLRSCLGYWGTFCAGVIPKAHFCCCHWWDSNPCRRNLYKKCQRLNGVGHCEPLNNKHLNNRYSCF